MKFRRGIISTSAVIILLLTCLSITSSVAKQQKQDRLIDVIQMPVAVDKMIEAGISSGEIQRIAGALNRGAIEPRYFNETLRRVPAMANKLEGITGVGDFVENQVKSGVRGKELAQSIHGKLLSLEIPSGEFRGQAPSPMDKEFISAESRQIIKGLAKARTLEQQPAVSRGSTTSSSGPNAGSRNNAERNQSGPSLRDQSGGPVRR